MTNIAQVLTIAGSDSGGGAGIQADLKTFQMRGVFGTSVLTAVTAQNTQGVFAIHPIPTEIIHAQLQAIAQDFDIRAFKVGMLGTAEIIECVAAAIKRSDFGIFVLDPVMIAKGGSPLLQPSAIAALKSQLLPLATVITPNIPEAEQLTGIEIVDEPSLHQAAHALRQLGAQTVIIKGGHALNAQSENCRDWVFSDSPPFYLASPRFHTPHTHGTGCTFSACLTAELAKGQPLPQALRTAKAFITEAIRQPLGIGQGHGPTNHWAYQDNGASQ